MVEEDVDAVRSRSDAPDESRQETDNGEHATQGPCLKDLAVGIPLSNATDMSPGAYAVDGPSDSETLSTTSNEDSVNYVAIQIDAVPSQDSISGLVVAHRVADEGPPHLPQAEHVSAIASISTGEEWSMQFKTRILVMGILGVIIILILVAVLAPGMGSSKTAIVEPGDSPSPAPTAIQDYVLSLLPQETMAAIEDPTSPQSRALQWLLDDSSRPTFLSEKRIIQRFALATLFYATKGEMWTSNKNWLNYSINECDWFNQPSFALKASLSQVYSGYLAEMHPPTEPPPKTCDSKGVYQNLWLDQNNLIGSLPDEIYLLTSLKTLSIGLNQLKGTISSHVGQLTSLDGLGMFYLQNQGTIPTEFGLLTNLKALSLLENGLIGTIPAELWQLTNLGTLDISNNFNLQGTIPTEIGTLSNLRWLLIDQSDITGTLPTEIGQIDTLEWMVSYQNSLTGTLPSELGQISKLSLLSLLENSLEGALPSELGLLTSLSLLSLRNNHFTGPIPIELGLLNHMEVTLNLGNNLISGTIPSQLGLLTKLQELSLVNNELSGGMPSELGLLMSLGQLGLANNSLSSTIPLELSRLHKSLHTMYLEGNPMLSGIVPEPLCHINSTCIGSILDPCEGPYGLSFDCSSLLCGCGACACLGP